MLDNYRSSVINTIKGGNGNLRISVFYAIEALKNIGTGDIK